MIVTLHHVHIVCSGLSATESWFLDGLGAELVERRESRGLPTEPRDSPTNRVAFVRGPDDLVIELVQPR